MTAAVALEQLGGYTADGPPPADHLYASAIWLVARYPVLLELAERLASAVHVDNEGLYVDLDFVADTITSFDGLAAKNRRAEEGTAVYAFACMSRTEQSRLRLLATFSTVVRVGFKVGDLGGFDEAGQRLIADWFRAVGAA